MYLKLLLIGTFILMSVPPTNAQMSGSYTVGTGGDYTTISDAIAAINSEGLSGDVTIDIAAGFYAERIELSNLNNGAFTVALEGEDQQSTIISPPNQDNASIKAGIVMQTSSNVILRNLTYSMSEITNNTSNLSQGTYGIYMDEVSDVTIEEVVFINATVVTSGQYEISGSIYMQNTNNITIASCRFEGALRHIEFDSLTDLTVSNNSFENAVTHIRHFLQDDIVNNLMINENTFLGGYTGIHLSTASVNSDPRPANVTVKDNEFTDQKSYAIRLFAIDHLDVNSNRITSDESGVQAMQVTAFSGSRIRNNIINTSLGINLYYSNVVQLYNNIIAAKDFSLELYDARNTEVVHNTFHVENDNSFADVLVWIYGDSENLSLLNNIFNGTAPDPGEDENTAIQILGDHVNMVLNYNLYDSDLPVAIDGLSTTTTVNGTIVFEEYSLSEWNNLVNLDQHSAALNPDFLAGTDFRIGSEDYRFGTYLPEYSADIDGETRVDGTVDVGADQFCVTMEVSTSVAACESFEFDGLTLTESGEYLAEMVASNGCDSMVTLNLTILEPTAGSEEVTAEGSYNWNGIIYSESGTYEQILTNQAGCDSVVTIELTIEPYFIAGNFIIGSSAQAHYADFTEAVLDLQHATVTGNIEYFVETGIYYDTLKLHAIKNGDFSITFNGEDKATTILHPLPSIVEDKAGILIDSTNNITIRNLTLEMDDISDELVHYQSNDTKGISIVNAENITLQNIDLKNDSEAIIFNDNEFYITTALLADYVNALTISNCSFSGAGSHITLGDHHDVNVSENAFQTARRVIRNTATGTHLSIEDNNFNGPFRRCLFLEELEDLTITDNRFDGIDPTQSDFAIRIGETNRSLIQWNKIENVDIGIDLYKDISAYIGHNEVLSLEREALYATRTSDLKVVNNFFGSFIYLDRQADLDFIHNTVVAKQDWFEVIYFEEDGSATEGSIQRIINNIIVGGNQIESLMAIVDMNDSLSFILDHNLYYFEDETESKPLITYNGTDGTTFYTTLEDWQNEGTHDQNSQSFAPTFVSDDDFHITGNADYRFGIFLSDVTTDIDGEIRNEAIGVDVGADQYCAASTGEEIVEVCESYEWNGTTYTESGVYTALFTNALGCDSTATLQLTILAASTGEEIVEVCEFYEWHGTTYTESGVYSASFTNATGCDSTATLQLTILATSTGEEIVEVCEFYEWNGTTYTQSGVYEALFTNAAGCDSTATLQLTILDEIDCSPTSTSEVNQIVEVYPNPTFDGRVYLKGFPIPSSYRLFDSSGKEIASGTLNDHQFQLPSKSGLYLLQVDLGNERVQLKIINYP